MYLISEYYDTMKRLATYKANVLSSSNQLQILKIEENKTYHDHITDVVNSK